MSSLRFLFLLISLLTLSHQFAKADALDDLENEMSGVWLVKVEGEDRTRTLKIYGLDRRSKEGFFLEADYGWSTGEKTPIEVELVEKDQERKLAFTTQPGSKVIATRGADGKFSGTFTPKKGPAKGITVAKITSDQLESLQKAELNATPSIQKASADVPAACAAFVGGWNGVWPGTGRVWLWIVAVDSKCVATYSYGISDKVPKSFKTADIVNGVLTIPRPLGRTWFEIRDGQIYGRHNGSAGENSAVMQRVNTSDDRVAILRVAQVVDKPMQIPPKINVPQACAAFYGNWTGTWASGNLGQRWLRVFEVDERCITKYSFDNSEAFPKTSDTAEIKDGYLSVLCPPGICRFKRSGDGLSADYDGPDGTNSGGFRRIE